MNVGGGEAADQLVRMMLSGSEVAIRLSGSAAKDLLALTMALAKQNKQLSGKVNMARMLRETRDLRLFPMTPEQYKAFKQHAKKQRLLFSAIRDKDNKGELVDVVMPVTELDRANMIFERIKYTGQPERSGPEQPRDEPRDREPARKQEWDPEIRADAPKKILGRNETLAIPEANPLHREFTATRERRMRGCPLRNGSQVSARSSTRSARPFRPWTGESNAQRQDRHRICNLSPVLYRAFRCDC